VPEQALPRLALVTGATAPPADELEVLAARFAERAEIADRTARLPVESLEDAARAGLQALTVPTALGGRGAGIRITTAIARRLGQADPAPTLVLVMNWIQHALVARNERWPVALRHRVAQDALAGRGLMNALRVEPALGTPTRGGLPDTVAHRTAGGWRLTGRKIYSTGAGALHWYAVFARTDDPDARIGYFLVPANAPGIRIEEQWDTLGMRASASHDVVFDGTPLSIDAGVDLRSPGGWSGMDAIEAAWAFLPVAGLYLGIAEAARDWLVEHLRSRVPSNLGSPLASLERFQTAVGEIEVLLATAASVLEAAAERADVASGPLSPGEPGIAKYFVTEQAIRAVEAAVALTGNPGLSRRSPLERHLRNVLFGRIHTPQSDMVLRAAGAAALAVDPSRELP